MRIGVLTGGGDCPGLNAVIRAVVRTCDARYGSSVVGFLDGELEFVANVVSLARENYGSVSGFLPL